MTTDGPPPQSPEQWRSLAVIALAALAVLLVVLGVIVGLLVGGDDDAGEDARSSASASTTDVPASSSMPGSPSGSASGGADPTDAATDEEFAAIGGAASAFMTSVNTYGPDLLAADGTMPNYRQEVSELLTEEFKATFFEGVPAAEASVEATGVGRTATVTGAGVSRFDSAAATALVSGSFTDSYPENAADPDGPRVDMEPSAVRLAVELRLVDGSWLIDSFTPVTEAIDATSSDLGMRLEPPRAAASRAVEPILAYDYRDMDASRVRPFMTDGYWAEYEQLFSVLAENAPAQQTVVTAQSLIAGIATAGDDYVDVLVFVNRNTENTEGRTTSRDAVTVRMVESPSAGWVVDDLRTTPAA